MMKISGFGIIGMGVMGKSLALNLAGKNVPVSVYNRHVPGQEEQIASSFAREHNLPHLQGFDNLDEFINSLERPRKILLMITAGAPVDAFIKEILPYLKIDDIIMDGGNSFYSDTDKRVEHLKISHIHFLGIGISGGEEGALKGPSLMAGGTKEGYKLVEDILMHASAKDKNGQPCCAYIGDGGAGHFVKMVHNGIEYAEMQLLAETYDLLKRGYGLDNEEVADFFEFAGENGAGGFLTEATVNILRFKENGKYILDQILDKSGQKGTGGWTVQTALAYGSPISTITEAVMARLLSSNKEKRINLSGTYEKLNLRLHLNEDEKWQLLNALNTARLINHLSGFDFIHAAAMEGFWNSSLSEVARIWTNGCIIRSNLMEDLVEIFNESGTAWKHSDIIRQLSNNRNNLAEVIGRALKLNIAVPVFCASVNHFNALVTADSSASMIQAQRDYFGAHTYQRKDRPPDQFFHTDWMKYR